MTERANHGATTHHGPGYVISRCAMATTFAECHGPWSLASGHVHNIIGVEPQLRHIK